MGMSSRFTNFEGNDGENKPKNYEGKKSENDSKWYKERAKV